MKLNRNKKILLGLACVSIGFVLYKYFGNVVEGYTDTDLQTFKRDIDEVILILAILNDKKQQNLITSMTKPENKDDHNVENINKYIEMLGTTNNNLIKVINIIFPGTYPGTIKEGYTSAAERRRRKREKEEAAAAAAKVKEEEVAIAATVKNNDINTALKIAITSYDELIKLFKTIYTDNPIVSEGFYSATPPEKIMWWCRFGLDKLFVVITSLKKTQGIQ